MLTCEFHRASRIGGNPTYGLVSGEKPTARRRRTGGFSLVELIVVIGIIAVLAGLLLPALGKARATVLRISCANNLRNIHQATMLYVDDNASWLPPVPGVFATYYLNEYLRQNYYKINERTVETDGGFKALSFTKMSGVYFCPSITKASSSPFFSGAAEPTEYYSSYDATCQGNSASTSGGCWIFQTTPWYKLTRKMEAISGNCVLVCDRTYVSSFVYLAFSGGHSSHWQYSASYPWYAPAFLHQKQSNFLFKDGHVQAYQYTGKQLFDNDYIPID